MRPVPAHVYAAGGHHCKLLIQLWKEEIWGVS